MSLLSLFKRKPALFLGTGFLLLSVALLGAWAFWIEPDRVVVKETTLRLAAWPRELDGLRLAVLSDFHVGSPHIDLKKLERIVETTNRSQPEVVLLLGDYVIQGVAGGKFVEPEAFAPALGKLKARCGVYAVLGNHDWWYDGARVRRALEQAGITVLENEAVPLRCRGRSLWLAGVADLWTRRPDIPGTLGKIPGGGPILLLTHSPDIFPDVPARVALTLAGHTHGGQVCLPWVGRPVVPSRYGQRYALGFIQEDGRRLFVTTGIGTSILPVRFQTPPEISVLILKS